MNTTTDKRTEWLKIRTTGIGASDSAAILGVNPYRSPFQVWSEKCGYAEPDDLSANEAVEFGVRLERPIAEAYAERTGRNVAMWPQYELVRHHEHDWLYCTPDATQFDEVRRDGLVEIKTTSAFRAEEWADGPPLAYQVQLQHQMAVTGHDWGTLVVLIGGQRLRYFDCDRNQTFIDALILKLSEFWMLVATRSPPAVDGSISTARVLAKIHPQDSGDTVVLPSDAADWTADIAMCKETIKAREELKTECENRIKAALGDATYGVLPDGSRWSWKTQERRGYVVEPTTVRTLRKVK